MIPRDPGRTGGGIAGGRPGRIEATAAKEGTSVKKGLRVRFRNVREIRMGSPYRVCAIAFEGDWIPPLPADDWQDLRAASPDGRHLALVRWNTEGNVPGFHVVRIDTKMRTFHKTRRILGLCKRIFWDQGRFSWER